MANKIKHSVSFSDLPRKIDSSAQTLTWNKTALKKRLLYVLELLCETPSHVHVEFVGPVDMGALNWQFRGKDSPTDVLSFAPHASAFFVEDPDSDVTSAKINLGDLAICLDVCARQAKQHRCSLAQEVERMLVHGVVHLKGLDHERSRAAHAVMTALETAVRRQVAVEFGEAEFCTEKIRATEKKRSVKTGRKGVRK